MAEEEGDVATEIDALYALEPGAFVAARTALVKQLKAAGRKEDAAAVGALRKPSVVAGALNHTARDLPEAIEALIEAAGRVAAAQEALLAGGDPSELRSASAAQREAARAVVGDAVARVGPAQTDAVRTTVDAALADPELVERLRAGTLTDTLAAPAGFGFGLGVDTGPVAPRRASGRPTGERAAAGSGTTRRGGLRAVPDPEPDPEPEDPDAELRAELERLEAQQGEAEAAFGVAQDAEQTAATDRDDAEEALAEARARLKAAEAAHDAAGAQVEAARTERDRLAALVEDARSRLDGGGSGRARSGGRASRARRR